MYSKKNQEASNLKWKVIQTNQPGPVHIHHGDIHHYHHNQQDSGTKADSFSQKSIMDESTKQLYAKIVSMAKSLIHNHEKFGVMVAKLISLDEQGCMTTKNVCTKAAV